MEWWRADQVQRVDAGESDARYVEGECHAGEGIGVAGIVTMDGNDGKYDNMRVHWSLIENTGR